jgi:hypothetical protein
MCAAGGVYLRLDAGVPPAQVSNTPNCADHEPVRCLVRGYSTSLFVPGQLAM